MSDILFNYLITNGKSGYKKLNTMNDISIQLFTLLMSIATHRYKWSGLPKELTAYHLEKVANFYGQGVLIKYNGTYAILQMANTSMLNIYNEPVKCVAIAMNGLNFGEYFIKPYFDVEKNYVNKQNAVWLRNNDNCTSTYFLLKPVIERLSFIWESLGIHEGLSRIKALVYANKNISPVIRQQFEKLIGNDKAITVVMEKTNALDDIKKIDLGITYDPTKYWEDFDKTFALACQLVGITTNIATIKKERLVTSEVESNDELTTITEDIYLEHRKQFCKEVKEVFGDEWNVENKYEDTKPTKPNDKVVNKTPPVEK